MQVKTLSLYLCPVAKDVIQKVSNHKRCSYSKALDTMIIWASNHWAPGSLVVTARKRTTRQQSSYCLSDMSIDYLTAWADVRGVSKGRAAEDICIAIALKWREKHGT